MPGDVIRSCISIDSELITVAYFKNGKFLGRAGFINHN
jgi:hypothetical protein